MVEQRAPRDLGRLLEGVSGGFVENRGQVANADVRYYAQGKELSLGLTSTGVLFTLQGTAAGGGEDARSKSLTREVIAFRLDFVSCQETRPRAVDASGHLSNFYIGNDPGRWLKGVAGCVEVVYDGLYPGIDLRFSFKGSSLKYEFIVGPGADPTAIRMRYLGVESTSVDATSGEMLICTSLGTLRDSRPMVMQTGPGGTTTTSADFLLDGSGSWGFSLPPGLDASRPFIIDPGLQYCSYLCGSGDDWSPVIARANDGGFFVATLVYGPDFPDKTGEQGPVPEMIVLCKLDKTLREILFSTFFGGNSIWYGTWLTKMLVRSDGNVILTGRVDNETFPTTQNALFRTWRGGSRDGMIVMLGGDGELLYSSFIGGSRVDASYAACVDEAGNLYVTIDTDSTDIPTTPGAYCETAPGNGDAVLCKLDSTLTRMVFCTYIGGTSWDVISGCEVDSDGNILVCGNTASKDFPFTSPPPLDDKQMVYLLKMDSDGSEILKCVGSSGEGNGVPRVLTVSPDGAIIIIGDTAAEGLEVKNPIQANYGGNADAFITAYDASMESKLFCSYFGGTMADYHTFSVAWDESKDILYASGYTESNDFPTTKGCYDGTNREGADSFIFGINVTDFSLAYSTYVGGSDFDISLFDCIEAADDGCLVMAAAGTSLTLPCTPDAMDTTYGGGADVYLFKVDPRPVEVPGPLQGLKVESFGNGYVNLSWPQDNVSEYVPSGYRLYRGPTPDFEAMRLLADAGANLSYNNTDLVNGREYYYRVAAVNGAGEGTPGEAILGVPMDYPGAPLLLSASTGNGTVSLTWMPPAYDGGRLVGYRVWRGLTDECPDLVGSTEGMLSLTDANVTPGVAYYYRAQAYNELGGGNLSEYERIKAIDVPTAPRELKATGGLGEVVLAWKAPASDGGGPLLGYSVYRGTSADDLAYLDHLLPGQLSYRDAEVLNGTTYHYRLSALSGAGLGKPSEVVGAMPYGPPTAVVSASAKGGNGSILVEWAPPLSDGGRSVTGYKLYAGPAADAITFLKLVDTGTTATHAIENGVRWYFAVSAVNEAGEGPTGATVWATAMGAPSAPTQLRAQKLPGTVVLSWSRPATDGGSPGLTYRVLKGTAADALAVAAEVPDLLTWTDTVVVLGGTYFYGVLAVNLEGAAGPMSDVLEVYMAGMPGAPASLNASAGNGTVRLYWSPPADDGGSLVVRYVILRGPTDRNLTEVATVLGSRTEYLDVDLVNGETYHYAVQAENDVGVGASSVVVTAVPMPPPGKPVLKVELKGDDVVLTWTSPSGETRPITGYIVYRGPSRDRLVVIAELGLVLTYTDKDAEAGRTYYYSVSGRSDSGEGAPADAVRLEVEQGLPISSVLIVILVIIIVVLLVGLLAKGRATRATSTGTGGTSEDGK